MQFKTFTLSTLLLALPEAVFATQGDVQYVKALGISEKNFVSLNFQPLYFAEPVEGKSLAKRQYCVWGETPCYDSCCKVGTVCGIYDGEVGCCPIEKTCITSCKAFYNVDCTTHCCFKGTTCGPNKTCKKETDGDRRCDAGYSLCKEFDGCCPNGVRCILPSNCAIPCAADNPICGKGCCEKGYYCTKDEKCARLNRYTSLEGPTATIPPQSGETTKLQYHTYTDWQTLTTQTPPPESGAAPAMGAMLDGLGMAAGVLGVFAI